MTSRDETIPSISLTRGVQPGQQARTCEVTSPSSESLPSSEGLAIQPKYITLKDATETVRLSKETLKRAIKAGNLRAFKPGGKLLLRPEDLQEWIERREAKVDPKPVPKRPEQTDRLIDQVLARRVEAV